MSTSRLSLMALMVLLLLFPVVGEAQLAGAVEIPRTPWGRPAFQGVWTNSTLTPLERPAELGAREFHTAAEVAALQRVAVQQRIDALPEPEATVAVEFSEIWMEPGPLSQRTSLVTGPTGKIPPFTPAARQRLADGLNQPLTQRADSHEDRGYSERCLRFVTGGPPMMAFPFAPVHQIFQTPDHVAFLHEENHEIRVIHLDERPPVHPRIRLRRGDSRGRWEGDTLVIETTNFNGTGGFRGVWRRLAPHRMADPGWTPTRSCTGSRLPIPRPGRSRGRRRCRYGFHPRRCMSTRVMKGTTPCRSC